MQKRLPQGVAPQVEEPQRFGWIWEDAPTRDDEGRRLSANPGTFLIRILLTRCGRGAVFTSCAASSLSYVASGMGGTLFPGSSGVGESTSPTAPFSFASFPYTEAFNCSAGTWGDHLHLIVMSFEAQGLRRKGGVEIGHGGDLSFFDVTCQVNW